MEFIDFFFFFLITTEIYFKSEIYFLGELFLYKDTRIHFIFILTLMLYLCLVLYLACGYCACESIIGDGRVCNVAWMISVGDRVSWRAAAEIWNGLQEAWQYSIQCAIQGQTTAEPRRERSS